MKYPLGTQVLTEMFGTMVAIYFGECILANELLPKTKGHEMGFGWVALGFAFAFSMGIYFFQFASAHLNPAFCLTLWINNKITGTEFVALSAAEFAGAFIGAVLVWLHYMPHFKTVPEPQLRKR
jgi:glycerol uptake facilitator protein